MMNHVKLGTSIIVLVLAVSFQLAVAQQPMGETNETGPSTVKLRETEITRSVQDIIKAFKLPETEITGSLDRLGFDYILLRKDPNPFPDEGETTSRELVNQHYMPLDFDAYRSEAELNAGR